MAFLTNLSNEGIATIGVGAQLACAIGVLAAGRWKALFIYLGLLPLFWAIPFGLASAHLLAGLDGIVILPVAFLAAVCWRRLRTASRANEQP